jgi:hypothetical protein
MGAEAARIKARTAELWFSTLAWRCWAEDGCNGTIALRMLGRQV